MEKRLLRRRDLEKERYVRASRRRRTCAGGDNLTHVSRPLYTAKGCFNLNFSLSSVAVYFHVAGINSSK